MTSGQKCNRGFTLIELIMVVAIIGILASIAVTAYQTYTVRSQVAEALHMAAAAKSPVIDAYHLSGSPPADRSAAGLTSLPSDTQGKYVSEVDVINGRVQVTFGNDAHQDIQNLNVSFTPYISAGGSIVWRCGAENAPAGAVLLSGGGVTTAHQAPSIDTRYLPSSCRN